jgi:circadian clock protein KaiC
MANRSLQSKISTGTPGLDQLLDGGFPTDRLYLIQGEPGTGKTTMALQFLLEGVRQGETCLFITLSETQDELRAVAQSHGWKLDGINIFELSAAQQARPGEANTLFHPSEIELNEVTQVLLDEIQRVRPSRVVIDSLSEMRVLAQSALRFRRQILALKQHFVGKGQTVVLLDDKLNDGNEAQAHTVAHGVLELEHLAPDYGPERRRLRFIKVRGVRFRGGYHDYVIEHGGVTVFPRLIAADHRTTQSKDLVSSGVAEIDQLMGGGIDRGTSMLLMGPAGCGKTSLATQFAWAAIQRGERASFFLFDEGVETLLKRSRGISMQLDDAIEKNLITVRQVDPAEMSPGEFAARVRESVQNDQSKIVVIDSLNGYMNAMPDERFLTIHMHELLTYLGQQGVFTILIMAQHGMIGKMDSPLDVSYLSDTVVLLRYFEAQGAIHQAISVMKKRTGWHERSIREFKITSEGVRVGEPLTNFHGILTGVPTYTGDAVPLMKGSQ